MEAHSQLRTSEKATGQVGLRLSTILSKFTAHALNRWGRFITVDLDDSTYQLLSMTAKMKGVVIEEALSLLLRKAMQMHDTPGEVRGQIDALQEKQQTLAKRREELFEKFSRLSQEYSTLRYRYHEAFIENRILAMPLCGRGLASKYSDLVDRYVFTKLY